MTNLRSIVIASLLMTTLSAGMYGFLTDGLTVYNAGADVDAGNLQKLDKLGDNSSRIAANAQDQAEQVESKSDFFSLPGIINTLLTVFDAIPIWEQFIQVFAETTGIDQAGTWIYTLVTGILMVTASFIFVKQL